MAGPGYLDQPARPEPLAHAHRHLIVGGAVDQRDGHRGRRESGRVGDGITFGDILRPPAHQAEDRAPAQVPLRAQSQRGARRQGDHMGVGERSAP